MVHPDEYPMPLRGRFGSAPPDYSRAIILAAVAAATALSMILTAAM